ncbi:MAG: transcriptional regulator [Blastopirellula sp.]|nr:MAG: transcriptional regulator [Blastopirellula sp.]
MQSLPECQADDHEDNRAIPLPDEISCNTAAALFRALGEPSRLQLAIILAQQEMCVTQLAKIVNDSLPSISQRLKLLKAERIVTSRREGKHVFYKLDDDHIAQLIRNAVEHAGEK